MQPKITRKDIETRYESEEKIGIHTINYHSGERVEPEDITDDMDTLCVLPNGEQLFCCTNSAKWVVNDLGQGDVYGFASADNPVEEREIRLSDGHDFAVIGGRFVVDLWIKHYVGVEDRSVFDLKDPDDQVVIKKLYGDPRKWQVMLDGGFIEPGDPKYPHSKRLLSYEQRQEQQLEM